jgi:hypothetical protein
VSVERERERACELLIVVLVGVNIRLRCVGTFPYSPTEPSDVLLAGVKLWSCGSNSDHGVKPNNLSMKNVPNAIGRIRIFRLCLIN